MNIVILAAGKGKRMHSDLPKVLHALAGKPLVLHVVEACEEATDDIFVVVHTDDDRANYCTNYYSDSDGSRILYARCCFFSHRAPRCLRA